MSSNDPNQFFICFYLIFALLDIESYFIEYSQSSLIRTRIIRTPDN